MTTRRTKYKLAGKHAIVSCAACHKDFSTPTLKKPAFATCASCHKDAHAGTATLAGKSVDCASCHTVNGYVPSTYTVASHATTKYPLEGKHTAVKCGACHTRSATATAATKFGTAKVVMRPAFAACTDCHADDHGGQLKDRADKGQCSACHRVTGWTPSTFDSAAHAKLKLGLDGKHQQIDCVACHGGARPNLPPMSRTVVLGKANFLFAVPELQCTACHTDPHKGRFVTGGARAQTTGCPTCHSTQVVPPLVGDGLGARAVRLSARGRAPGHGLLGVSQGVGGAGGGPAAVEPDSGGRSVRRPAVRGEARMRGLPQDAARHPVRRPPGGLRRLSHGGCLRAGREVRPHQGCLVRAHGRAREGPLRAMSQAGDPKSADPNVLMYRPLSGRCESCHSKESP